MLVKFECRFQLKIIRGSYHLRLRGILLFDTVSSPFIPQSHFHSYQPFVSNSLKNSLLCPSLKSAPTFGARCSFVLHCRLLDYTCFFRFVSGLCGWWGFIFSLFLVLPVKLKTDGCSSCTLSWVLIVYILLKHDSKPTETAPREEMSLISLQRRQSFWLIDLFSLKISWKGWDERGADLFLWQAEEA